VNVAVRNLALCKELTQTSGPAGRSEETILVEMFATLHDLTAHAHDAYEKPQGDFALSGKK